MRETGVTLDLLLFACMFGVAAWLCERHVLWLPAILLIAAAAANALADVM